ncbi:MAG: hypothetical protein ACRCU2_22865, partial [Planktothrix sp.]
VKCEKIKHQGQKHMNLANEQKLKYHLREVAKILKEETPNEQLQNFEQIELATRKHILETVGPEIGTFFFLQPTFRRLNQVSK